MKELGESCYNDNEYRKLFNIIIDSHICEDKAIGITNDGELLYIENKLMNNSSAYWVQSIFYSISKKEFCVFLEQARSRGFIEEAIQKRLTTEGELKKLSE